MSPFKKKRLVEVLLNEGSITRETLDWAVNHLLNGGKRIGTALIEAGIINEEQLAKALASQYGLPYYNLEGFRVDPAIFEHISVDRMYRYPFVCYRNDEKLVAIISDPTNLLVLDEIEILLGQELEFGVSTRKAILDALKRSEGSAKVLKDVGEDLKPQVVKDEVEDEAITVEKVARDTSPIIKLVDTMILDALSKRASDIHIEPTEKGVVVKYRVDGALFEAMEPLDKQHQSPIISRIKVMSELDIAEKRVPQDGRFKLKVRDRMVDFRVSIMPSLFGEDVVIRILDKESITAGIGQLRLNLLGFNEADLKRFRKCIYEPYGMVLVTGPTGSGKTTTLYAAITEINNQEDKIVTIEDPVEYQLNDVVQIPVNEKKGLTFARGLRSILRHDPDKIMVGEIRDPETAQIAIQAALTGHLVFTTVHANNAFDVIGRFINMGIEPYNFVSSLNCILAQRLVRTICHSCKESVSLTPEICETSGLSYKKCKDRPLYRGRGCPDCNGTGYIGRTAISEFLDLSDRIKEMILEKKPSSEIRRAAIEEGMTTLRQAAVEKVFAGETTLREINRVTFIELDGEE